jgi:hypothetical protein
MLKLETVQQVDCTTKRLYGLLKKLVDDKTYRPRFFSEVEGDKFVRVSTQINKAPFAIARLECKQTCDLMSVS